MTTARSVIAHQTIHHEPGPNPATQTAPTSPDAKMPIPGSGIEQAEQKIRPLGPRLRDRRRQRAAADKSGRRADARQKPRKTQHVEIA